MITLMNEFIKFQFDNIKRVFKHVEELKGSLIENIKLAFQLSDDLSRYVILCLSFKNTMKNLVIMWLFYVF